jgi:hypothetical protein
VEVNLTASHRPLYVFPVETIDESLQGPFLKHGAIIGSGSLGLTPDHIDTSGPMEERYPMPPEGEGAVWQTWVPLTEGAQFIEMQVWYAPEILASSEGDTRFNSLSTSSLQIETLGGRENAIALLMPN